MQTTWPRVLLGGVVGSFIATLGSLAVALIVLKRTQRNAEANLREQMRLQQEQREAIARRQSELAVARELVVLISTFQTRYLGPVNLKFLLLFQLGHALGNINKRLWELGPSISNEIWPLVQQWHEVVLEYGNTILDDVSPNHRDLLRSEQGTTVMKELLAFYTISPVRGLLDALRFLPLKRGKHFELHSYTTEVLVNLNRYRRGVRSVEIPQPPAWYEQGEE